MKKAQESKAQGFGDMADKIELVDTLEPIAEVKEVIMPYLNALYQDLILRSEAPDKGIPRVVLTEV